MTTTAIGIMSGTSLDGLDIAYCRFKEQDGVWKSEITAARCVKYDNYWHDRLAAAHRLNGVELITLDTHFGRYIAEQVNVFVKELGLQRPDLLASHGHTVFHAPDQGFTLQIGSGAQIAAGTGIRTVNNFRSLDVALGGQGAPLVPIGDRMLFEQYGACLNLGGFSNISFEQNGERRAMDICPVNIVLNPLAARLGLPFDRNGDMAAEGTIIPHLLERLDKLSVYHSIQRPSLSREWVENEFWPLLQENTDPKDLLRTVTEHAANRMAAAINSTDAAEVLITGGGAYNGFLMTRLEAGCKVKLTIPDETLVEFKEALVFALLGVLRVREQVNVLRSVTGARLDSCSGVIHLM